MTLIGYFPVGAPVIYFGPFGPFITGPHSPVIAVVGNCPFSPLPTRLFIEQTIILRLEHLLVGQYYHYPGLWWPRIFLLLMILQAQFYLDPVADPIVAVAYATWPHCCLVNPFPPQPTHDLIVIPNLVLVVGPVDCYYWPAACLGDPVVDIYCNCWWYLPTTCHGDLLVLLLPTYTLTPLLLITGTQWRRHDFTTRWPDRWADGNTPLSTAVTFDYSDWPHGYSLQFADWLFPICYSVQFRTDYLFIPTVLFTHLYLLFPDLTHRRMTVDWCIGYYWVVDYYLFPLLLLFWTTFLVGLPTLPIIVFGFGLDQFLNLDPRPATQKTYSPLLLNIYLVVDRFRFGGRDVLVCCACYLLLLVPYLLVVALPGCWPGDLDGWLPVI